MVFYRRLMDMSALAAKEIQRRNYLEAMGVVSHVSRVPLPGAAPTRKLLKIEHAKPVADAQLRPVKPPENKSPEAAVAAPMEIELDTPKPRARPAHRAKPQPAPAPQAAPFSMLLAVAGDTLWLEEIPHRSVNRHYTALVSAMIAALSLPAPRWLEFDWPMHNNVQLGLDEQAARQMLDGYLSRQWSQLPCQRLVILGEKTRARLSGMQLPEHVLLTQSAWDMLSTPALKPIAWQELQTLR